VEPFFHACIYTVAHTNVYSVTATPASTLAISVDSLCDIVPYNGRNSKFSIKVYKLLCTCGFPTTLIFSTVLVADLCVYINRSMVSVVASHLSSCVNIEATLRASLSGTFLQEECRKPVLGVCREVGLGCHSLSHSSPVPDKPCMVSVDVKLQ